MWPFVLLLTIAATLAAVRQKGRQAAVSKALDLGLEDDE